METDHLEVLGLYERIILKAIFKNWPGAIDWIGLAQDEYK
jgi:hypothetical protein